MKPELASLKLTDGHVLQRAHHQAVVDVPHHPVRQRRVLPLTVGDVGQDLGESVAADGGGVNQQRPAGEVGLLQHLQHLPAVFQPPARPQEVHDAALHHQHVHTVQVEVAVLGHGPRLGPEPGEEEEEGTGGWLPCWIGEQRSAGGIS